MTKGSGNSAREQEQQIWRQIQAGKLHEAAAACDQLNLRYPEYDSGWHTASQLAMSLNEPGIALQAIDRALRLSANKAEWMLQKMSCLGVLGDLPAANALAAELADHQFSTAYHSAACALTLNRLGVHEAAARHYRSAIEFEPENGQHHYNLATVLRFLGRLDEAKTCLDRAVELNPGDYEAYLLRSGLQTQTTENNNIDALTGALERSNESDPRRVWLCYALAKELEDVGEFQESFERLRLGASARRRQMQYRPEKDLATMQKIREVYGEEVYASRTAGHVSAEPIFIIGMPRTGTTLIDRILSSHSVVQSAGELQNFGIELVKQCASVSSITPSEPAELVPLTRQIDHEALGDAYIKSTRPLTGRSAHFVDKLPMNFLYMGLIHLALPKARIIWVDRDPMDACYAIYKTLFAGAYPYSYDLTELANYYVGYRKLMSHWQAVLPGVLHVVRYEDLVGEPRPVIEALLDYCNLSWEEQCLNFHENRQATTTASAAQVRYELHSGSIGKWRNYEAQLKPVADILRNAGICVSD